jgi:hypothetical protein
LDATLYVGQELKDDDGSFVVDADRAERVQFALDYIKDTENEGYKVISEKRVDPAVMVGESGLSGTVDIQLIGNGWIELVDYKDGMNPVDAANNHQLELYAVGVLAMMPTSEREKIETITMTIIQPKLRLKGMSGISSHTITQAELRERIIPALQQEVKAIRENPQFTPGESQCKYCAAKGGCSALVNHSLEASGISFQDLSQQAADKEPNSMSDQELRTMVESAPLIRQMLEAAEKEALRRMESGITIEGLKMVRGRGSRGWSQDDELIAASLKKMGLPKEVIWQTSLISVAQAEKAKWIKKDGTQMQLSENQLKRLKTEFIKQSEGKITVAPESDSRPAVSSVASMFEPVVPSWLS